MSLDSKAKDAVMKALSRKVMEAEGYVYIRESDIDDVCDALSEVANIQYHTEEIVSGIKVLSISRRAGNKFKPLMKIRIM